MNVDLRINFFANISVALDNPEVLNEEDVVYVLIVVMVVWC